MGAPSGSLSSSSGGPSRVYKTADETVNNSATFQDDDELVTTTLEANAVYAFRLVVRHSGTTTSKHKITFSLPAGASWVSEADYRSTGASSAWNPTAGSADISFSTQWTFQVIGPSDQSVMNITGFIVMGENAGVAQVQWAQNVATAEDTKQLIGSYLEWEKAA